MNNKILNHLILCSALTTFGCTKEKSVSQEFTQNEQKPALGKTAAATQVSGVSFFDVADGCNSAAQGAAYALNMTGSLTGCLYTYVDGFDCSPSGTYREVGREFFVGTYNGKSGTFWTNYKFEAKYEGCAQNGSYVGAEIKGRCQHPIAKGSGTGAFLGVTGRLDMKDDIQAGNYPYEGHLKL